jgi:ABC-type cobalamin/Fe3+-siderophores transport system ATPase subunit
MNVIVNEKGDNSRPDKKDTLYLCEDKWDDYEYKTTFDAIYYNCCGESFRLGKVRIGFKGMDKYAEIVKNIPRKFDLLEEEYFSLGWDVHYYENVFGLGDVARTSIHKSLRDMAYDLSIFDENINEDVVKCSLLRERNGITVRNQFHRISTGGVRLTMYNFRYSHPERYGKEFSLDFNVVPESYPPTNIHVLIGRNGTGKTRLIRDMVMSLRANDDKYGTFNEDISVPNEDIFANILCVAYGPFDDFSTVLEYKKDDPFFSYIGLNKTSSNLLKDIQDQFMKHFERCMNSDPKKERWSETIEILKSDPLFTESNVEMFVDAWKKGNNDSRSENEHIENIFKTLSSGHKVILLIVTACVDRLEERSIVFLDEPENHLHPPLLSAFIRALSNLLINRNGVAIISTHSPVILQEVPRSCVWWLNRSGDLFNAKRLSTETFGETITSLTREVFGLEIIKSGFHKMLLDKVNENEYDGFDDIVQKFGNQLGCEAQYALRALLSNRNGDRN